MKAMEKDLSMKNGMWRYGSWLGVLAALAVAVSIFACGGATSSTPASTPTSAPTPTPTVPPTPPPASAPPIDVLIDDDTTWQELFDGFTPAEQDCIRTEVDGELDSLLDERVMTDDDLPDWQVSLFECLAPETARSVYTSLLVAGMINDETYDVTEQEMQCVSQWVADADVHRLIRGMADDDLTVLGEAMSGVIPCMVDFFMPEFLAEIGIDADALTDDERTCLNHWMVGYDWSSLMTAIAEDDLGIMGQFLPGLISCAPGPFLALFFEDTGLDLNALTDEEKACLEDWLTDFDWDAVLAAISAAAFVEDDETYSILAEAFGLLACIPDLDVEDLVGSGSPDDYSYDFADATPIAVGKSIEGVIDYDYDVGVFELSADAGQVYRIDVALGTLDDSVLTVYDTEELEVAYNDDYGDGTASRIVWSAPSSDVYYVKVSGFFSTGSYTLTVDPIEVTDDYPNSPYLSPTTIAPGQSIESVIDYDYDVDVFRLTANADESYRIDVSLGTLEDSVLTVYDADGLEIAYNDDYGDGTASRIVWDAPASGNYYVEVSGYDSDTGSYTLTVESLDLTDDYPNSPYLSPTTITPGQSIEGVINYKGDVDVFRLTADAGQFYRLDVSLGTLDDSDLAVYVYDTEELAVAYNDDYGDGTASRIVWRVPSSDVYYFEVSGFFSTGSYTLTVEPIDVTDDYPNSPDLTLPPLTLGQPIEGAIDYDYDVDVFKLSANAGQSYRITVSRVTLDNSVLAVSEADDMQVAYNEDYGHGTASRIIWEAPATGDYYVKVSGVHSATGSYTLTVAPQ